MALLLRDMVNLPRDMANRLQNMTRRPLKSMLLQLRNKLNPPVTDMGFRLTRHMTVIL